MAASECYIVKLEEDGEECHSLVCATGAALQLLFYTSEWTSARFFSCVMDKNHGESLDPC